MILLPRFELIEALKLITKLKPKMMPGVPTLFNAMLQHPRLRDFDLTSLEVLHLRRRAAAARGEARLRGAAGCTLTEGYGLSETSPVAACNPHRRSRQGRLDRPAAARHRRSASLARGPDAWRSPRRDPARSASPAPGHGGYWNKPEETASVRRRLLPHRRCRLHGRGRLHLHRRPHQGHDHLLRLQVYPRRIEDAIYEHPAVAEVTVIGIPDAYRGEAPKAFVRLKEGRRPRSRAARFPPAEISKIEMPAEIEFRESCPRRWSASTRRKSSAPSGRRKADRPKARR